MTIVGNQIVVSLDNILFATDFSPSAETARFYVQALAGRYQSQVRLMHVVDLGTAFKGPDAGLSIDMFRRFGEESLARLGSELSSEKIRVETTLCEGTDPGREILRAVGETSHRPIGDWHAGQQGPGPAGSGIDGGRADSSGQMSHSGHRALGAGAKAADRFSADCLCHRFLAGGCASVRVCPIVCPGFRRSSLSLPCAARRQ